MLTVPFSWLSRLKPVLTPTLRHWARFPILRCSKRSVITSSAMSKGEPSSSCVSGMRFVQFEWNGRLGVGVEKTEGGDIVDVTEVDPTAVPRNMRDFIQGGESNMTAARIALESGRCVLKRRDVKVVAPISNPEKILCVGMNYRDHCEEQGAPVPEEPVIFSKFNSAIIGPTDDLVYPEVTQQLDWEVELVIVMGKTAKNVPVERAMEYVFGFTVAHDVSAKDWMIRNGRQVLLGKSMDGFCPLGPVVVMKEDVKDPHNLKLWTRVNGVVKQDSNTNQLVFKTPELVAFISRFVTLKPGDLILTGTPPGTGAFRKPPEFLQKGDVVEVEIEGIGKLTNRVV